MSSGRPPPPRSAAGSGSRLPRSGVIWTTCWPRASSRPERPGPTGTGAAAAAKVFVITDAGRSAFEHAYDDLASNALRFLAETAGPDAIAEFARRQVSDLERRYAPAVARGELPSRVQALAEALSADGYAASAGPAPAIGGSRAEAGEQLCQHHCPVAHVAAEFPQLCEAETEAFGRLLGTPVQRLATIAHGDGICTTHVTGVGKAAAHRAVEVPVTKENTPEKKPRGLVI